MHVASKFLVMVSINTTTTTHNYDPLQQQALCEQLLTLGRLDVNPDVRDRARSL